MKLVTVKITEQKLYNFLRYMAQVGLPALGTCYAAIAGIWGLPHPQEVLGTVSALNACLGTMLMLSDKKEV